MRELMLLGQARGFFAAAVVKVFPSGQNYRATELC